MNFSAIKNAASTVVLTTLFKNTKHAETYCYVIGILLNAVSLNRSS